MTEPQEWKEFVNKIKEKIVNEEDFQPIILAGCRPEFIEFVMGSFEDLDLLEKLLPIPREELEREKEIAKYTYSGLDPDKFELRTGKLDTTPTKAVLIDEITKQPKEIAFLEFVINALDAINDCKKVDEKFYILIICDPKKGCIHIKDNGSGMVERQLRALTTIGDSFKQSLLTKRFIGTWGTAFVISCFNIGKNVEVETREEKSDILPRKIVFPNNYAESRDDRNWKVDIGDYKDSEIPDSGSYTKITIKDIKRPCNSNNDDFWVCVKETIEKYVSRKLIKMKKEGKDVKIKIMTPSGTKLKIKPKEDDFYKSLCFCPLLSRPVLIKQIYFGEQSGDGENRPIMLENVLVGISRSKMPVGLNIYGNDRLIEEKMNFEQKQWKNYLKKYIKNPGFNTSLRIAGQFNFVSYSAEGNLLFPWQRLNRQEVQFDGFPYLNEFQRVMHSLYFHRITPIIKKIYKSDVLRYLLDLFVWEVVNEKDMEKRKELIKENTKRSYKVFKEVDNDEGIEWLTNIVSKFVEAGQCEIREYETLDEWEDQLRKSDEIFIQLLENTLTASDPERKKEKGKSETKKITLFQAVKQILERMLEAVSGETEAVEEIVFEDEKEKLENQVLGKTERFSKHFPLKTQILTSNRENSVERNTLRKTLLAKKTSTKKILGQKLVPIRNTPKKNRDVLSTDKGKNAIKTMTKDLEKTSRTKTTNRKSPQRNKISKKSRDVLSTDKGKNAIQAMTKDLEKTSKAKTTNRQIPLKDTIWFIMLDEHDDPRGWAGKVIEDEVRRLDEE